MLVKRSIGRDTGCPSEKPLLNSIHSPVPTTPQGSACPGPPGQHYLNGPKAEAVEQGSSQQAPGEAEDRSERAGGGWEQGEVGKAQPWPLGSSNSPRPTAPQFPQDLPGHHPPPRGSPSF